MAINDVLISNHYYIFSISFFPLSLSLLFCLFVIVMSMNLLTTLCSLIISTPFSVCVCVYLRSISNCICDCLVLLMSPAVPALPPPPLNTIVSHRQHNLSAHTHVITTSQRRKTPTESCLIVQTATLSVSCLLHRHTR